MANDHIKAEVATATCAKCETLAFTVSELGYIAKASSVAVRHVRFNRIGIYHE